MGNDTIDALTAAGLGPHSAVLDLTGMHGLTDDMCHPLLVAYLHLQQFSLKHGRRLTFRCLQVLCHLTYLSCIDVGSCFNNLALELTQTIVPYLPALTDFFSPVGWVGMMTC